MVVLTKSNPLKIDPTRSITLRRSFSSGLSACYGRLARELVDLIVKEDAFGLGRDKLPVWVKPTANVFCPTGPGGGIDPSCSPSSSSGIQEKLSTTIRETVQEWGKSGCDINSGECEDFAMKVIDKLGGETDDLSHEIFRGKVGRVPSPHDKTHSYIKYKNRYYDSETPEGVTSSRDLPFVKRWLADPTTNTRWKYKTQSEALEAFEQWARNKVASTLISQAEANRWEKYIQRGFEKGANRAFDDTSKARKLVDATLRGQGFIEGRREQFIRQALGKAAAIEKLKLLQSRTYTELKGLTQELRTRLKRSMTDSLVRGLSPRDTAAKLVKDLKISKGRAETIAFTELVRAHADGQLEAMEQLGIEEVGVAVEWSTAENPCPLCDVMEGVILRISEAKGMLPRHPRCRCAWVPANIGEDKEEKEGQKRGKYKIDQAIKRSKRLEMKQVGESEWNPGKRISRSRPMSVLNIDCSCSQVFIDFERVYNVFCATGPGGGIDPSCTAGGGKSKAQATALAKSLTDPRQLPDSKHLHTTKDGKWTANRKALHKEIVADEFKGKTPVDKPISYIMGGGPAAGKSTIIPELDLPKNKVSIAPDDIKVKLPEYKAAVKANDKNAGNFVHKESGHVADLMQEKGSKKGYNTLVDGTGDGGIDNLAPYIQKMRDAGQKVVANYVTVDTEVAVARAAKRGQETGRFVPEAAIRVIHKNVSEVVPEAIKRGLFDEFTLWDTEAGGKPIKVATARGKRLNILDADRWKKFVDKGAE